MPSLSCFQTISCLLRYSREDVLATVFQDEDSDFEEESGEEGSDTDEEFDVLSGSGEETEILLRTRTTIHHVGEQLVLGDR